MNHKAVGCLLLALSMTALTAGTASGQGEERRGTAGATWLLVPTSARTAALGTAAAGGISSMTGLEALYSNPAGLTHNSGTNAMFSHVTYFADINVNTFGIARSIGSSNLALVISAWDFGDIPLQTEAQPEISDVTFSPSFVQAGVSYARQLTDRIAVGATAKVVSEDLDVGLSATGIALDAGMSYAVGESGLRFGVALKNFGAGLKYGGDGLTRQIRLPGQRPDAVTNAVTIEAADAEFPAILNFGVSYTRNVATDLDMTILGNYRSNSFAQDQFAGGLEFSYNNLFFVRGSYEWQEDMDQTAFEGWGVGAGLNFEFSGRQASFDYSYSGAEFFDAVQVFTVNVVL